MIPCRYATSLNTEAREGALTGVKRVVFELHMKVCPACKAFAKGIEQNGEALAALPKEGAPEELKRSLMERLRARRS